jgi:hypothetical protein
MAEWEEGMVVGDSKVSPIQPFNKVDWEEAEDWDFVLTEWTIAKELRN